MRSTTRTRRRAALPLLALAAIAACQGPAAQEPREVAYTWTPPKVDTVAGVPAAAITAAVDTLVRGAPPAGVGEDVWKHVKRLYKEYGNAPLWMESAGPIRARTEALLAALVDAQRDALRLDGYPLEALAAELRAVRAARPPSPAQLARADVLLSSAYLALAEDLLSGQTDPKEMTTDWHISARRERLDSAVVQSLRAQDLAAGIQRMRPEDPDYEGLRQALARLRARVDSGGWQPVPEGAVLKPGDSASVARLAALRGRLRAEGFDAGPDPAPAVTVAAAPAPEPEPAPAPEPIAKSADGAADVVGKAMDPAAAAPAPAPPAPPADTGRGVYDGRLAAAVSAWQAHHGIAADGILGAETVKAMNVPAEYRLGQVAASLERHRWMPRSLGQRYIHVNVPAFRLRAVDSTGQALEMKVIVGADYEGRTTPVFADSMETVVFRPYWNVTPTIQEKEIAPAVARNPGYLARNNMEYYRDGSQTRIRQKPGPKNSLGLVKFLFPNSFNIYLHDTPQRLLFLKDMRAFSHGCIRLEKPDELAQWVLGWDAARVEEAMEDGPNDRHVRLPKKIPVYISYFTAYTRDGELFFGNDLYSRDEKLVTAMAEGARTGPAAQRSLEEIRRLVTE